MLLGLLLSLLWTLPPMHDTSQESVDSTIANESLMQESWICRFDYSLLGQLLSLSWAGNDTFVPLLHDTSQGQVASQAK